VCTSDSEIHMCMSMTQGHAYDSDTHENTQQVECTGHNAWLLSLQVNAWLLSVLFSQLFCTVDISQVQRTEVDKCKVDRGQGKLLSYSWGCHTAGDGATWACIPLNHTDSARSGWGLCLPELESSNSSLSAKSRVHPHQQKGLTPPPPQATSKAKPSTDKTGMQLRVRSRSPGAIQELCTPQAHLE
jgi:hypothetical protein